jgi:hypothetical protein
MDSAYDIFDTDLRLHEIAIGTKLFTAQSLVFRRQCGHHDDLDVFCLGG